MVKLPAPFVRKMQQLLRQQYEPFIQSYNETRHAGLRVNTAKMAVEAFCRLSPFPLSPIAWAPEGFYIPETERPGKHPYYHAGLYYVQEPSAMAPVELLDVQPGDKVLDLCAAPGGKSTQIAAKLHGRGQLVTNDNSADRVKALVKNIELYGVTNAIVMNETPDRLAAAMPSFFDKILVDAPCSGEGMFRKDESMVRSWDESAPARYAAMQKQILAEAARMLKPGGTIVYSTCTFSPEENESIIAGFLQKHGDFHVALIALDYGFAPGRPDWVTSDCEDTIRESVAGTVRLWPHLVSGEGHFVARLRRLGGGAEAESPTEERRMDNAPVNRRNGRSPGVIPLPIQPSPSDERSRSGRGGSVSRRSDSLRSRSAAVPAVDAAGLVQAFASGNLEVQLSGGITVYGSYVYASPENSPALDGLKVARPGWFLGTMRGDRFEPSHALAMGLKRGQDAQRHLSFAVDDGDLIRYLKGETLQIPEERIVRSRPSVQAKGYCLVCVEGCPLGWGKWLDGMLKNEYPPGWRWT